MEPRIVFLTPKNFRPKAPYLQCEDESQCVVRTHDTSADDGNLTTVGSCSIVNCISEIKKEDTTDSGLHAAMETALSSVAATLNLSPPPSFSRLPPDGHEFPPNYQEPCPDPPSLNKPIVTESNVKIQPPPPLPSSAQPIKMRHSNSIDEPEPLRKYSTSSLASSSDETPLKTHGRTACWRNDEKSEKSVRDKIAMFSNVNDECPVSPCNQPAAIRKLNRYKSSEDVFNSSLGSDSSITLPSVRNLSKSVLSVDKVTSSHLDANFRNSSRSTMKKGVLTYNSMLDVTAKPNKPSSNALNCVNRAQSSVDLALTSSSSSSSCSSSAYSSCSPESSLSPTASPSYLVGYSSTLPRKHQSERKTSLTSPQPPSLENKPTLARALSFTVGSKLHTRSQSLVDVGSSINKCTNSLNKLNTEEARRASLNALIEQRRRSISKLRGLVIPEKVTEVPLMQQTIVDLPEIISKDSVLPNKKNIYSFSESRNCFNSNNKPISSMSTAVANNIKTQNTSQSLMTSPPWKSESSTVNDIPKYSPAFKRKSLALYGVSSSASSVSSSLSSSREELRPYFDTNSNNITNSCNKLLPKQTKSINQRNNINYHPSNPISVSPSLQNNEPPKSLESITSPTRSDLSFEFISSAASSPDVKMMSTRQDQNTIKANQTEYRNNNCGIEEPHVTPLIKMTNCSKRHLAGDTIRSGEEESDNDSAVSSSRSSISHDFSPPTSPLPDGHRRVNDDHTLSSERQHIMVSPSNSTSSGDRRTLRRTLSSETTASAASSTGSTLTSGSQASCSSSGSDSINRRVLKAQSVEAINRKNVLSSARFSSGQDLKVGSPLIRRKFENPNSNEMLLDSSVDCNGIENENYNNESNDFIDKLNKTLKKEDSIESVHRNENDLINYQLMNCSLSESNYPTVSNTKVAYVEMEVTDGPQSLPNDLESKFSDEGSGPPSMDDLNYDYTHEEKVICSEDFDESNMKLKCDNEVYKDSMVNNVFINNTGINNISSNNNNINRRDSESTIEEVDTPSKPFIKRISRDCHLVNSNNNSQSNNKNLDIIKLKNNSHNNSNNTEGKYKTDKNNDEDVNNFKNISKSSMEFTNSLLSSVCKSKKENYGGIYENNDCDNYFSKEKQERANKTIENSACNSKVSTVSARAPNGRHSISVNDIRKAFEKPDVITSSIISNRTVKSPSILNGSNHYSNNNNNLNHIHARVSSLDSTTSEDSCAQTPTHYGSITNLQKEQQFGSITSLASSTSLISQQELQQLIDDANQTLEETTGNSGCSHEVLVVILHRDTSGGSVGITLAGGADYEAKEITVHKVLAGSPADRDGRIQKGDRILSINGRSMKGMTHRESLAILKAPRPEVVLVVSRWRPEGQQSDNQEDPLVASLRNNLRPPRIPEQPVDVNVDIQVSEKESVSWGPPVMVCLNKDGAGLGFSLEGGKDSPLGDMPLTIKKIFTGGCAEKSGELFAGDELLAVNGTDVTSMSRIEAWSLMKRIADGKVKLSLRHRATSSSAGS